MGELMPSSRIIVAGLSLVTAVAASAMLVTPALASPARTTGIGQYKSWSSAQHAAGFSLKKPRTTYGLKMNGRIVVDKCLVIGHFRSKVVDAQYGSFSKHQLGLEQDNAGISCTVGPVGPPLGSYRIDGVTARLHGYCGTGTGHSCKSQRIELLLTWKKGTHYYIASSYNEPRSHLVHFARTLRNA